jgi:hypothetical protein
MNHNVHLNGCGNNMISLEIKRNVDRWDKLRNEDVQTFNVIESVNETILKYK